MELFGLQFGFLFHIMSRFNPNSWIIINLLFLLFDKVLEILIISIGWFWNAEGFWMNAFTINIIRDFLWFLSWNVTSFNLSFCWWRSRDGIIDGFDLYRLIELIKWFFWWSCTTKTRWSLRRFDLKRFSSWWQFLFLFILGFFINLPDLTRLKLFFHVWLEGGLNILNS